MMGLALLGGWPQLILALAVGAPLAYSGVSKLLNPWPFVRALPAFGLPIPSTTSMARVVGWSELLLGAGVIATRHWLPALAALIAYAALTMLVGRATARGASGDCGCFGAIATKIDRAATLRNAAFSLTAGGLLASRLLDLPASYPQETALLLAGLLPIAAAAIDTGLQLATRGR